MRVQLSTPYADPELSDSASMWQYDQLSAIAGLPVDNQSFFQGHCKIAWLTKVAVGVLKICTSLSLDKRSSLSWHSVMHSLLCLVNYEVSWRAALNFLMLAYLLLWQRSSSYVCCYVGWYEITWISPTAAGICTEQLTLDYVSILITVWNNAIGGILNWGYLMKTEIWGWDSLCTVWSLAA